MSNRRRGLGLLGLLAVTALGTMALAASAQALTPEFLIAKKLPAVGLAATFTGALEKGTITTLLVPAFNVEINCAALTFQEGVIGTSIDANVRILFESCTASTIIPLEELPCEIVTDHKGNTAHHITATGLVLPAELTDNVTPALLVEKLGATVLMKSETGCPLLKSSAIAGELCLKIAAGTNDTAEPLIFSDATTQGACRPRTALNGGSEIDVSKATKAEIEAAEATKPPMLFLDQLIFDGQEAFLDFKATLKLTGAHTGLTLGVSLQ